MVIYVDIDNTICRPTGDDVTDYSKSEPISDRIDLINSIYAQGHEVVYWTARGTKTGIDWLLITENQLANWGAKYTSLKMGKPAYDLFIDDKAISDMHFFGMSEIFKRSPGE